MTMNPHAAHAVAVLQSLGWSKVHAVGAVANIQVESGINPSAVGDHGQARGICQWHPDRQSAILHATGINVRTAGLDEQLRALDYEMRHNQPAAYDAVRDTTTPFAAGYAFCAHYEVPADLHRQATMRGNLAAQLYASLG